MGEFILHGEAEALLALWYEARGAHPLPPRTFIDPLKLRRWIADISIVHLHEGPRRLYVSLHGENVAWHLGPNFHKRYLEDAVPPSALRDTVAPYDFSTESRLPCYSIQRRSLQRGKSGCLERMVLPCCADDPHKTDRFLVWVAPIAMNDRMSPPDHHPCDAIGSVPTGRDARDDPAKLFALRTDRLH